MTWFKVDDGFAFHPKAIAAGNAALGLWVRAGAWCGANLTDGALPKHMIGTFGAQARDARKLVEVGLWVETPTGYQFHEWHKMQPTKASVEAEREKNRGRQKAWRDRKNNGGSNAESNGVTNDATNAAPSRPVLKEETSEVADAPVRPEIESLLDLLDKCIEANGAKKPSRTKKNQDAARLLLDKDGYTIKQVEWMIHWATSDTFWKANILSMVKLREKFDQLKLQATSKQPKTQVGFDGEIDVNAILGHDAWVPGKPPEGLSIQEEITWKKEQRRIHNQERLEEARRKVNHDAA